MIGIQGETALEEVTKSPADAALSTTSTNSVQNKVITKLIGTTDISSIGNGTLSGGINKLNNDLAEKIIATSTTTTRGADLLSLKTAFNALSDSDKRKVIIEHGVVIYHITKKNGLFEMTQTTASNIFADQLDIENGTCGTFMTGIGGALYADQTAEPNTEPYILIRI